MIALHVSTCNAVPPAVIPSPCARSIRALPEIGAVKATGRISNLIGIASSASEGVVGQSELSKRSILRPGELLETVPGLVISQHSGEGKANQYYLRGFNLDHGTDIAVNVGGIPANMRTHAHGQGYADVNWVIPEIVETINYQKGTYYADQGDFATAGAVNINYFNALLHDLLVVGGGPYGQARTLFASSPKIGNDKHLLVALEYSHTDNTALAPDNYRKYNAVARYSRNVGDALVGVTMQSYTAKWRSSDQIPLRAVQQGQLDRFGRIDPTDGGETHRNALSADYDRDTAKGHTKANAYLVDYGLRLFSNFTYYLNDPINMDQFLQKDQRLVSGLNASHSWKTPVAENTVGYQFRNDNIPSVGLYATKAQTILSTTRASRVVETSHSFYAQSALRMSERLRVTVGLRGDLFSFKVNDERRENSGRVSAGLVNPKFTAAYKLNPKAELYLDYGQGFHSNDARGVTQRVDPATGSTTDSATGQAIQAATPLVRAKGGEIGARFTFNKKLRSTISLWSLSLASELVFAGDAGTTEASRPSRRQGIELANFLAATPELTYDLDYSTSRARFSDSDPVGYFIPGSIKDVLTFGATMEKPKYFGSVRLRYFGPRPLIEDGSVASKPTTTINFRGGYKPSESLRIAFDVFNVLNTAASDIDYYYNSSIPSDPGFTKPGYTGACPVAQCGAGVADIHFHPIGRRVLRFTLTKQL